MRKVVRGPRHSTVVAYLALFVALGGTTYAVTRVDSRDVVNNSLKSKDLRDRKAVAARDVRPDALTGKVIRESTLDANDFSFVAGGAGACMPLTSQPTTCAEATVDVPTRARALVVGSGTYSGQGAGSTAQCQLLGSASSGGSRSFEGGVRDSFVVTGVHVLPFGRHSIRLECTSLGAGGAGIEQASVAVLGLGRFE